MKECDLQRSCEILAYDFSITKENSLSSKRIDVDRSRIPERLLDELPRQITHTYMSPTNTFYITSMDQRAVTEHALAIIGNVSLPL